MQLTTSTVPQDAVGHPRSTHPLHPCAEPQDSRIETSGLSIPIHTPAYMLLADALIPRAL